MGIPTLDLRPGAGLGPFVLGNPICEALAEVEQQQSLFESTVIKYCEQDPLQWDVVVVFPHLGFHLCFDPRQQRLYKIEVYDVSRIHIRYANAILGGPSVAATFARMYSILGPTFPGSYDSNSGTYALAYPGLSLLFPIPPQYAGCYMRTQELPLEFPDGTTPVVNRICLHIGDGAATSSSGSSSGSGSRPMTPSVARPLSSAIAAASIAAWQSRDAAVAKLPPLPLPSSGSSSDAVGVYMEEVHVRLGESVYFTAGRQLLCFGASPQDVWSELGRPCSIVQKQMNTMFIHLTPPTSSSSGGGNPLLAGGAGSSTAEGRRGSCRGEIVWSYFVRGIDVVFDAETHTVTKFVLHTNIPGHSDFNEYVKCNFVIFIPTPSSPSKHPEASAATAAAAAEASGVADDSLIPEDAEDTGEDKLTVDAAPKGPYMRPGETSMAAEAAAAAGAAAAHGMGERKTGTATPTPTPTPTPALTPAAVGTHVVTADSRWRDVQQAMTAVAGTERARGCAPVQTAASLHSAFGPTFVYGVRDAAFEVTRSGHICTVTLFQT